MSNKIKMHIERTFYYANYKPYHALSYTHKIKRAFDEFHTLKELKDYYGIQKLTPLEQEGWAISPTGKKHTWKEYTAEIGEEYEL